MNGSPPPGMSSSRDSPPLQAAAAACCRPPPDMQLASRYVSSVFARSAHAGSNISECSREPGGMGVLPKPTRASRGSGTLSSGGPSAAACWQALISACGRVADGSCFFNAQRG